MLAILLPLLVAQSASSPAFRFTLDDGSVLRAVPLSESITVRTAHGNLVVKWADLKQLSVGPRLSAIEVPKYEAAIKQVGSSDYPAREAGTEALLAIGPRVYHKMVLIPKTDMEARRRADIVIRKLTDKYGAHRLIEPSPDTFQTFTVSGTGSIAEQSVRVRTAFLGDATVELAYVRSVALVSSSDVTIKVGGGVETTWIDTGIDAHGTLHIQATGQMDFWPGTPGQYVCGPAGLDNKWGRDNRFAAGTLICRFGYGEPQRLADGQSVNGNGRLWLAVNPSTWNQAPVGEYTVRVFCE